MLASLGSAAFLCCSAGESNVVIREVLYSGQAFPGLENVLDLRPTPPSGGPIDRSEQKRGRPEGMMSWSAIFLGWEGTRYGTGVALCFIPRVWSFAVFTGESAGKRGFFLEPMLYVALHCITEFKTKRGNGFDSLEAGHLYDLP